jgi:uncharacterized protein (TIGR03032 family)
MPPPIALTCSRDFLPWLAQEQISLAFTTYQTNRLFLLGLKPDGALSIYERLFDRPMGLFAAPDQLYLGCRYQIWRLDNALPPGETHEGYDALYVPRRSYTTGDVDIHDLRLDKNGRLLFVNTLYSCLATVSERYSFRPIWQPPFISKLAPEDRCHLNGLALADGVARYATAVSRSDVFAGWRQRREQGGLLMDIQRNEIVLQNLSMPHSPRLHEGKLWLLNAGTGDLGYVDWDKERLEPVAFCPGFARGLVLYKNYAIVGLSKPRQVQAFAGLSLDERLAAKDADAFCGLAIVDLTTGNIAHWVEVAGIISELYDVAVLPGVRRPMALGFKSDEISRFVTIEYPDAPPVFQPLKTAPAAPTAPTAPRQPATLPGYRFQMSVDMTVTAVLQQYHSLTFPPLAEQLRGRAVREPLVTVMARTGDEPIALALAEIAPDNAGAHLLSCFVASPHRRRGVATRLLAHLQQTLAQRGLRYLDLGYSTDWPSLPVVEHFLARHGWLPPQTLLYQYKVTYDIDRAAWLHDDQPLPDGCELFPWSALQPAERQTIQHKLATGECPPNLNPFQADEYLAFNSVGLRHGGEVAGWMVTHQAAPDAIQYTSFFLRPDLQRQGLGLALLAAAVRPQVESDVPYGIWQVAASNEAMLAFVRRYLQPYVVKQTERRVARLVWGGG